MPWAISDVDRHHAGLSDAQKRRWVAVANSVLERCIANGGNEADCAASAIRQANGVVNANATAVKIHNEIYTIRHETHQGRDHIVVPVVMMRQGVHNGSRGPLFHSTAELGHFIGSWNGIPIVIYHPVDGDDPVSANSPLIIDREIVGRVYNSFMNGDRLCAEAWIDTERITAVSPETLEIIQNQHPLDVSVGVFSDEDMTPGNYEGEDYIGIARNHRPDHLALLPGAVGACSWADGCGIRANEASNSSHACLHGDTEIPLLNGTKVKVRDLVGQEVWIYSYDIEKHSIVPALATEIRCSRRDVEVVAVELDNGEVVICTPDHRFMLRDGHYENAIDLHEGVSLMPLYRKKEFKSKKNRKRNPTTSRMGHYEQLYQPWYNYWEYTHHMVHREFYDEYLKSKHVIHHINENSDDNSPKNLQMLSKSAHCSLHASLTFNDPNRKDHFNELRRQASKVRWSNPEARKRQSEKTIRSNRERMLDPVKRKAMLEKTYQAHFKNWLNKIKNGFVPKVCSSREIAAFKRHKETLESKLNGLSSEAQQRFISHYNLTAINGLNHKVVSVYSVGNADVYDLTVDGYANFAIDAGIFVHNSASKSEKGERENLNENLEVNLKFSGTESTSWSSPTLTDFGVSGQWQDASQSDRAKVANHFLIGSASAASFSDLHFPVVNPKSGKLNEHALRAVISGRGAALQGVDSGKKSAARRKAYTLLNQHFNAGLEIPNNLEEGQGIEVSGNEAAEETDSKVGEITVPITVDMKQAQEQLDALLEKADLVSKGLTFRGFFLTQADQGFRQVMENIQQKLDSMDDNIKVHFLTDVFADYFIYEVRGRMGQSLSTAGLYKRTYSVGTNGVVEFTGNPVSVRREVSYVTNNKEEVISMAEKDKKPCCPEKVTLLIQSKFTAYQETDREFLSGLDELQINKLVDMEKMLSNPAEPEVKPVTNEQAVQVLKEQFKTPEQFISFAPKEMQEMLTSGLALHKEQRETLINLIIANSKFTKEDLEPRSLSELQKLGDMIHLADFSGMGGGTPPTSNEAEEKLLPVGVEAKGGK